LSGELYKQSLKRIHRLKQTKDCYYWTLLMNDTIDDKILNKLKKSQTYTLNMFESNIG
jgi:SNF2 family DNA or RNA helicase